jgi:pimeloyl-ACP methyl ester carboxylesterase
MDTQTDQKMETMNEYTITLPNGIRVRTLDEGSGPILLLLHGNPDNADEWKPLVGLLKDKYRCIAPDLPGYGRRGFTNPLPESFDYTRKAQVGFVDAVLAELKVQGKITLVVHDIGAIMGVPWAASHVDRLNAVVFTNAVAFPKHIWFELAYRWGNDTPRGRRVARLSMAALSWFNGAIFRRVFSRQHPRLSKPELDRFVTEFALNPIAKQTSLIEFRQITRLDFFDGYDQMLKTISESVPTVTVWGASDPYIADRFAKMLGARKTIILPAVGHWVPIVAADALAQQILSVDEKP